MRSFVALLTLVAANTAFAQHAGHSHQPLRSGYAGMQTREIKALSPEQVVDLREGRGMGASLPAELNGAPGPMHVHELSQQLKVTPEQRTSLERATAEMKASAQQLGAQVIAAEAELDRGCRTGAIDEKGIGETTARIAALQGQLRARAAT